MEGHKADSTGKEAAAWTQAKPASGQESINFTQAWGKQQAPSSGRKDSGPGEGLAQASEGAGRSSASEALESGESPVSRESGLATT